MLQFKCLPGNAAETKAVRLDGTPFGDRIAVNSAPCLPGCIHRTWSAISKTTGVIWVRVGQLGARGSVRLLMDVARRRDRANLRHNRP